MFNFNSRVMTKKTGLPTVGTVVGIALPILIKKTTPFCDKKWSELYPGWDQKPLYVVMFDAPQKSASLKECLDYYKDSEMARQIYESIMPVPSAIYPEDDLELFE